MIPTLHISAMNKPIHTQSVAAIFLCLFSAQAFGLSPAYEPLPLNAIKPRGWIYNQITTTPPPAWRAIS